MAVPPAHPEIPFGYPGGGEITANEQWTPVTQTFSGVEMVFVPIGCFMMGAADGSADEQPVHEQCFGFPYWIDKTEVTRAQYQACVDAGVCSPTPESAYSSQPDQPINRVTYQQAALYCGWRGWELSLATRLPTEREWEYAARGLSNLLYPWGNDFVTGNVVSAETSGDQVQVVGSHPDGASWVGAVDMSGNVREWVSSEFAPYPYTYLAEWGYGSDASVDRVLRGGAFNTSEADAMLRSTFRSYLNATLEADDTGFRCVQAYQSQLR